MSPNERAQPGSSTEPPFDLESVVALVLTYDAHDALYQCLDALSGQTSPVDEIIVIDNASPEPVDEIVASFPAARAVRLPENGGPAGGYASGLDEFQDTRHGWAWILDDDCRPDPDCLRQLREFQGSRAQPDPRVTLSDVRDADTGKRFAGIGWWGALVPRAIVEAVGVPHADLFWWTEDTEYLQWRIPQAGFEVDVCPGAIVRVSRARESTEKPAWKYYYEARNQVHHRLRVQRAEGRPVAHHLKLRVRAWRATRSVVKLATRAAFLEHSDRTAKLSMVVRGTIDGVNGRLGKTVSPDSAHRPLAAAPPGERS